LWACERLYDELAWFYDLVSWLVSAGHWRRWQAGIWQEVRGTRVLEAGCGTGAMVVQGAQRGLSMVGVDRSPAMLAVANKRIRQLQSDGQLLLGDGRALPLQHGSFDSVMATFPAGYILDPTTLAEMRRVLRPGGKVVILGLWVELHLGKVGRLLPLFYGRPSGESLSAIVQRVEAAGFQARWVEQRNGIFTVGVLVAERA
jgi:ubiquinone/menaquinone biosynthesis C-methylase UbiE